MLGSKVQWSSVYAWDKYPVHHTTCSNTRQQLTKICHKNKSWRQSLQLPQLSDTSDLEFKLYGSFDGSTSNVCFGNMMRLWQSNPQQPSTNASKCCLWHSRNADGAPKQQLQSTRGSGVLKVQNNLIFFASPQKKRKKKHLINSLR